MEATIYRYKILKPNWTNPERFTPNLLEDIAKKLESKPFRGEDPETQYGFAQCNNTSNLIYGLLIQKYPTFVIDYEPTTKEEIKSFTVDCAEYLFVLNLIQYEIFFQAKKGFDLPSKEEITKKFIGLLKLYLSEFNLVFEDIEISKEEVDREMIVKIFYEQADKVVEVEFSGFDPYLIEIEKRKRGGKRQTYFNPIEEYQEAMEEGALRMAQHSDYAKVVAKNGESLKKDPITRAMLEGSSKPIKIVYTKDGEIITAEGVTKIKEKISVEGDSFELDRQIDGILTNIYGFRRREPKDRNNSEPTFDF